VSSTHHGPWCDESREDACDHCRAYMEDETRTDYTEDDDTKGWEFRVDDWVVQYGNTGGGVMCWVARHPSRPDWSQDVYIGTASEYWGWDADGGESFGDIGMSTNGTRELVPVVPSDVPASDPRVKRAIAATLRDWNW